MNRSAWPQASVGVSLKFPYVGELVEAARAAAVVIGAVGVDRAPHADERGAGLPDAGTVAFSHAQNRDETEHAEDHAARARRAPA